VRPEDQLECLRREATKPSSEHEGLLAQLEQAVRDPRYELARETVWADAEDAKGAIFSLLDGKRVYSSRQLGQALTGRDPIEVVIIAKRRTW